MAVRCRAYDTSNGTNKNWQQELILHMQFVSNNIQPVIIRKLIRHRANFTHKKKLTFSVFKAVARRITYISTYPALLMKFLGSVGMGKNYEKICLPMMEKENMKTHL